MRASMRLAQLVVLATALSVAGCATGGPTPTTPHVAVSISAPTSGATVGVHKVTITGTVMPAGAQVAVNGEPAQVKGTTFTTTMYVASADQKIVVSGVAHGYVPAQTTATVSYSPNVAQQLVAAAASATAAPVSTGGKVPAAVLTQAFGLPATGIAQAGPTVGGTNPTPVSSNPSGGSHNSSPSGSGSGSGSSSSSGSGSGSPTSTPPGNSAPTGTPPSSTPTSPPAPTPAQIAAAIHTAWVHGCVHVRAGGDVTPYCTCTYNHLAGELQTPAQAQHVLREMVPYLRTGDFRKLPRSIRQAVNACVSKLPPLDPVNGKPVVRKLPGVQHGASAASTSGTQTDPGSTPVAPTPLSQTPATPVPNMRSAARQFYNTIAGHHPLSSAPAYASARSKTHRGRSHARLASQGGHHALREARIVANALGYAFVWVADHDQTGLYPYGYRVQRRLYHRLSAALKLAA
jgi:uncharacterized membrane protein YgcG